MKLPGGSPRAATQHFIPLVAVEGAVAVLRDGSRLAVLEGSGIAYDLRSDDDRTAILAAWRRLLNVIDFPVQFLVQVSPADVEAYLDGLAAGPWEGVESGAARHAGLMRDHAAFVREAARDRELLDRRFRVVIPGPAPAGARGLLARLRPGRASVRDEAASAEHARRVLNTRCDTVARQLSAIGLRMFRLRGDEIATLWRDSLAGLRPRTARRRIDPRDASPVVTGIAAQ